MIKIEQKTIGFGGSDKGFFKYIEGVLNPLETRALITNSIQYFVHDQHLLSVTKKHLVNNFYLF